MFNTFFRSVLQGPTIGLNAVEDLPADDTTPASVQVGGTFQSSIDTSGDEDWIAFDLVAGQTVLITVAGTGTSPLSNPYLEVYDSDGNVVQQNDNSGPGRSPEAYFTAEEGGTYYIAVSDARDRNTGDYTVEVVEAVRPDPLDALDWGGETIGMNGVVTVYFAQVGETFDGYTCDGWNEYEIGQFMAAFDSVSAVCDLTFVIVDDPAAADMKLVLDTDEISAMANPFLGYFNPPGTNNAGVGVFNGDAWDREPGGSLDEGGYDFVTMTHELLHGLGMSHPHDTGGGSEILPGVESSFNDYGDYDLNQGVYTTMSYNTGNPAGTPGDPNDLYGYESGPMALDIAVLQEKYGVNTTTGTGNTVYVLPEENASGTMWTSIWDVDGRDTIEYNGSDNVTIDLRPATLLSEEGGGGFLSHADGIAGGFTIANGVTIENATGGSGYDTLIGNDACNILIGKEGGDALTGNGGRDAMVGGLGADSFVFLTALDAGAGRGERDFIIGFDNDVDVIDLSGIDADAATAGNQALEFVGAGPFDGAGIGQVGLTAGSNRDFSLVQVDVDGDGISDLEIVVVRDDNIGGDDFLF